MRNWLGVEHQQKTSGQKKGLLLLRGGYFFRAYVTKGNPPQSFEAAGGDIPWNCWRYINLLILTKVFSSI